MPHTIVFASGKGGTGKTSTTAGVGCALAELGRSVLMIDADAGMQSLDILLGIQNYTAFDFLDTAQGNISLQDACVPVAGFPKAAVLSAPPTMGNLRENTLRDILKSTKAASLFEFILIDAPAGLGLGFRMAARASDMGIIVATTEPICLRAAERAADGLRECGVQNLRLVINRIRPALIKRGLPNIDDTIDAAGIALIGYVPEHASVILSGARGTSVLTLVKNPAAAAYRNIARRLLGEQAPMLKLGRR